MRYLAIVILLIFTCFGTGISTYNEEKHMEFTEAEILEQFDLAFNGTPNKYFPEGRIHDVKYNFFLDLEQGYCVIAGSRIHLYADSTRWAVVFEEDGYQNRGTSAEIQLIYTGNCIDYPVHKYPNRNYISNSSSVILIDQDEFSRIENKDGVEMETFELIDKNIKEIKLRDKFIPFDNNSMNYEKMGIKIRDYENPNKLIAFDDILRYLNETSPKLINATEEEIRTHIPKSIPKLMTIEDFHYVSFYNRTNSPSHQETYQLIAKVLTTRDTTNWKPTQKPNNSWKNWESGTL